MCKINAGKGAYAIPKDFHLPHPSTFSGLDKEQIEKHPSMSTVTSLIGEQPLPTYENPGNSSAITVDHFSHPLGEDYQVVAPVNDDQRHYIHIQHQHLQ